MKKLSPKYLSLHFFIVGIFMLSITSCKRELLCPDCNKKPPVAQAGPDQTITLSVNSIMLDGSGSRDADNNIVAYKWAKISGPGSVAIANDTAVRTKVGNVGVGTYYFELKVTDAGGLFDTDTVMVTIVANNTEACDNSNRPTFNAQLIPIGTLSSARAAISVASAGNKIVFAGGGESSRVDIYDIPTNSWSIARLSAAREGSAAIAAGNKIFFAGGGYLYADYFSNVDIYDVSNNSWTTTSLTVPKTGIGAAAVGNKVMFAGGYKISDDNAPDNWAAEVEVYDLTTNSWTLKALSTARGYVCGVTVGEKVFFAGGNYYSLLSPSNKIDVYDNVSHSWSTKSLTFLKGNLTGIAYDQNIYWSSYDYCNVEIFNCNSGASSSSLLSRKGSDYSVIKDGKIIFLKSWSNFIDVYDPSTNQWSVGVLPSIIPSGAAIISVNNIIYIAGGFIYCKPNGAGGCNPIPTNQVYKLEF
jgi:hypothetical protein